MKYRLPLVLLLGLLVLFAASTSAFSQPPVGSSAALPTAQPSRSESSLGRGPIRVENAQVVSAHKIQVAAQADGIIDQLLADEGHVVKKGDTLLMIDNRVALAELAVAQKELEAAEKQAEQTAEVDYAKKASEVSDAEYKDILELYNKGSATYSEARRKRLEKERALSGIDVANVKHVQEILAAEVNKEKVKASQVKLDLYKVIAPFDGIVYQRLRDQGEWIRSGEPILKLVHLNEMKVETFVPIDGISVAALQGAAMRVSVRINSKDVATYDTHIEFVSPEIESRRVRVATRIQNQQVGGTWLLRDGMQASIEI
ncbi:MAG: HlyD family efflux transporter periplasmic adaptor subunit, partial [Planctomycetales bacterium]|nr:HlyD family efflux transporter periplasmic adaptor subunit [Planctomycetales bacterium]